MRDNRTWAESGFLPPAFAGAGFRRRNKMGVRRDGGEVLRLRCAALRACEEIPPRRQFEHVLEAKLSLKSGVLRINSQALRMTCGVGACCGLDDRWGGLPNPAQPWAPAFAGVTKGEAGVAKGEDGGVRALLHWMWEGDGRWVPASARTRGGTPIPSTSPGQAPAFSHQRREGVCRCGMG